MLYARHKLVDKFFEVFNEMKSRGLAVTDYAFFKCAKFLRGVPGAEAFEKSGAVDVRSDVDEMPMYLLENNGF